MLILAGIMAVVIRESVEEAISATDFISNTIHFFRPSVVRLGIVLWPPHANTICSCFSHF